MIFSDRDIKRLLQQERIKIDPAPDMDVQLGSCSLDLKLDHTFKLFDQQDATLIDTRNTQSLHHLMDEVTIPETESFILQAGAFVLGATKEWVELPDDIVARLEGRSSLGRLGIIVHATASIIDPGWRGRITLELANHGIKPVALYPGTRICSLTFEPLSSPAEVPYYRKTRAKYINQQGALPGLLTNEQD